MCARARAARFARPTAAADSSLPLPAGVLAVIILDRPLRMIADPLRHVGLRRHHALLERAGPRELQVLVLAPVRLRDRADQHDNLDEAHVSLRVAVSGSLSPACRYQQVRMTISRSFLQKVRRVRIPPYRRRAAATACRAARRRS